jgi:hypothetical protein
LIPILGWKCVSSSVLLNKILNIFSGDPLDRSLRNVETEVLIPKKMRDKAKDEKCVEEVKGKTHQYTDSVRNFTYNLYIDVLLCAVVMCSL